MSFITTVLKTTQHKTYASKTIVIIPFFTCGSCRKEALKILSENFENEKYIFIVSDRYKTQEIRYLTDSAASRIKNLYITDVDGWFEGHTLTYPMLIITDKDGCIINQQQIR